MDNAVSIHQRRLEQVQGDMPHPDQQPALASYQGQLAEDSRLLGYHYSATISMFPPITEPIHPIDPPRFEGATQFADGASEILLVSSIPNPWVALSAGDRAVPVGFGVAASPASHLQFSLPVDRALGRHVLPAAAAGADSASTFELAWIDPILLDPALNPWGIGAPDIEGASPESSPTALGGPGQQEVLCPLNGRVPVAIDPGLGVSPSVQCPRRRGKHQLHPDDEECGGDVEERPQLAMRHHEEQDDEEDCDEREEDGGQGEEGATVTL
jgi:hypothetical protein